METSKGPIILELDGAKAPISVENFLRYAKEGFYDGTIFHRVMPNFMIQGGGFDKEGVQKATHAPIRNEWKNGLKNARGTIAMARTQNPDSATAQFFINVVDNSSRWAGNQPGYAVFGEVIGGMETVDAIRVVPTGQRSLTARSGEMRQMIVASDVPETIVEIISVSEVSEQEAKKRIADLKEGRTTPPAKGEQPATPAAPGEAAPGGAGSGGSGGSGAGGSGGAGGTGDGGSGSGGSPGSGAGGKGGSGGASPSGE
ncbi:MAG: peptidylprolyl isomerase [Phycisphaeraceae bacterium]|nr:peptidylprolyl isomerase [Phycisphaeraceae bacterium]